MIEIHLTWKDKAETFLYDLIDKTNSGELTWDKKGSYFSTDVPVGDTVYGECGIGYVDGGYIFRTFSHVLLDSTHKPSKRINKLLKGLYNVAQFSSSDFIKNYNEYLGSN